MALRSASPTKIPIITITRETNKNLAQISFKGQLQRIPHWLQAGERQGQCHSIVTVLHIKEPNPDVLLNSQMAVLTYLTQKRPHKT